MDGGASGGCFNVDNMGVGVTGNYIDLYELDPWDQDDWVQRLGYDSTYAPLACEDAYYCYGESDWKHVTGRFLESNEYEVDAQVRMRLWTDLAFY